MCSCGGDKDAVRRLRERRAAEQGHGPEHPRHSHGIVVAVREPILRFVRHPRVGGVLVLRAKRAQPPENQTV